MKLILTKGALMDFRIKLLDDQDEPEDIAGAAAATLNIRESTLSGTDLFADTTSGAMGIDIPNSELTGTISAIQSAALPLGTLIGQAAVLISGEWYTTDPFEVSVQPLIAAQTT